MNRQQAMVIAFLNGEIRLPRHDRTSRCIMTNIESSNVQDGDEYVLNGRKWYTTNATDPRCEHHFGKSFPMTRSPSTADDLVPKNTPGVRCCDHCHAQFYGMPDRASEVLLQTFMYCIEHAPRRGPSLRSPKDDSVLGEFTTACVL